MELESFHKDSEHFPTVLFSPALSVSRLLYGAIVRAIAGYGFTVLTIDHPYDAGIVEFPDGSLVCGANITTKEQYLMAANTRAQDASFLLDQSSNVEIVKEIIPGAKTSLNVSQVAMFGHSLGGAATATAMLSDSRNAGGVDMDGTLYGPVI